MITSAWNTKRRMVPRWRSLAATMRSKELGAVNSAPTSPNEIPFELTRRLERWRQSPKLLTAAELVETAIVEKREDEAVNAARAILNTFETARPLIKRRAAEILLRTNHGNEVPQEYSKTAEHGLRRWRQRTRLYPHDALAWVELALNYVIHRDGEKAARCMAVALQLAPDNRHVLRSASRLFLHLKDAPHAHDLLVRSPATKADPWLIAAEIAVAELAERAPRFYKQGVAMVNDAKLRPYQITELAGSVGTAELMGGNRHKAKKMFRYSMIDPTGNALAQAEWATPNFGSEIVPVARLQFVKDAFEAKAFHCYREHKYMEVLDLCELWSNEEPYSIRPYEFGASTAGQIDEYERSLDFSRRGLLIRPGAPGLVNSKAFALASLGRASEAETVLRTMSPSKQEKDALVAEANWGLIAFRRGDHARARQHYSIAIEGFERMDAAALVASARIYLAREAVIAKTADAPTLLAEARELLKKRKTPILQQVLARIEDLSKVAAAPHSKELARVKTH